MDKILIEGGEALKGDIAISGSKNAVLPLMVAGLLTDEKLTLRGTPRACRYAHTGQCAARARGGSRRVWPGPGRGYYRTGGRIDEHLCAL